MSTDSALAALDPQQHHSEQPQSAHSPSTLHYASTAGIDASGLHQHQHPADRLSASPAIDVNLDANVEAGADLDTDVSASATPTSKAKGKGSGSKRKVRGCLPGSTADFRRKEANRLAADRSRSRQAEKVGALQLALRSLGEENLRLRQDIAKMEAEQGISPLPLDQGGDRSREGGQGQGQDLKHALAPISDARLPAAGASGSGSTEEAVASAGTMSADGRLADEETETEDQAHSRTILAALMSDTDISQALDEDWMNLVNQQPLQQEDARQPEAEATTGHDSTRPAEAEAGPSDGAAGVTVENTLNTMIPEVSTPSANPSSPSTTLPASVALHAEIEKYLRDDVAATKAAIARIEQEIANFSADLTGSNDKVEGDSQPQPDQAVPSNLPDGILSSKPTELNASIEAAHRQETELRERLPELRTAVARMWEARNEEHTKLFDLANSMEVDEGERDVISAALQSISGYVSSMLGAGPELALNAPYSSPAIARRRRGRPPKTPLPIRHLFAKSKPQNASRLSEVHTSTEEDSRAAEEFLARLTDAEAASSRSEVQQGRLQGQGQGDHHLRNVYTSAQASTSPQVDLSTAAYGLGGHLNGDDSDVGDHDKTENGKVVMAAGAGCEICHRTQTTVWRKTVSDGVEKKVCNACGLYRTKFGIDRPPALWGDGKAIKKRRKTMNPNANLNGHGRKRKREEGEMLGQGMTHPGVEVEAEEAEEARVRLDEDGRLTNGDGVEMGLGHPGEIPSLEEELRLSSGSQRVDGDGVGSGTEAGGIHSDIDPALMVHGQDQDQAPDQDQDEDEVAAVREVARTVADVFGV